MQPEVKLVDIKKLAIEKRVSIVFKDSRTGNAWEVSKDGVLRKPGRALKSWKDIPSYSVGEVLSNADEFRIGSDEEQKLLDRQALAALITETFTVRGPSTKTKKDEDE